MGDLRKEIESAVNRASAENGSNTPDFILAEFLTDCLRAFDAAVNRRAQWYGRSDHPASGGGGGACEASTPEDESTRG